MQDSPNSVHNAQMKKEFFVYRASKKGFCNSFGLFIETQKRKHFNKICELSLFNEGGNAKSMRGTRSFTAKISTA